MTKQEADFIGSMNMCDEISNEAYKKIMCHCDVEVEESQPCEDCISREAVEKVTWEEPSYDDALNVLTEVRDKVRALPSVTPKYTDEEIQKMQELEQAQLDKAYELGMQTSFEEWLASFNTESATCCFTAVQELKKRLEVNI